MPYADIEQRRAHDRARARAAYAADPEKFAARNRAYSVAYRASHRAEINASARARYAAHPEKARRGAQRARYRAGHRAEAVARTRAWRAEHPAYAAAHSAAYDAAHREEINARQRARYAEHSADLAYLTGRRAEQAAHNAARKFSEVIPLDAWKAVWSGSCFGCGQTPAEGVDHVVPRSKGGRNVVENIQPACWPCNRRKHAR